MRKYGVWVKDDGVVHWASIEDTGTFDGVTYCGDRFEEMINNTVTMKYPTCMKCITRESKWRMVDYSKILR